MKAQKVLREHEALTLLHRECDRFTTQKDAAKWLGVSPQYLGDVLRGRRPLAGALALALGYERQSCFVPLEHRE